MKKLVRSTLSLSSALFTFLLIVIFLPLFFAVSEDAAGWLSAPIALIVGLYTWKSFKNDKAGIIATTLTGAILMGGIAFSGGFFGPMILAPSANQGPLLGILITGPAGIVIGAIAGYFYWLRSSRSSSSKD